MGIIPRGKTRRAALLVVLTVAALQLAVTLIHPNSSNFAYGGVSGHEIQSSASGLTSGVVTQAVTQVITQVVTQGTTETQTILVTPAPQTVTSNITLPPQTIPPDYTPIGIAIVVAVGILVLFAMFLKRKR